MDKLKLDDLFRYGFSGMAAIATMVLVYPTTLRFLHTSTTLADITIIGAVALLLGSIIYALHRAVMNPILYRLILLFVHPEEFPPRSFWSYFPLSRLDAEFSIDVERWERMLDDKSVQKYTTDWASQIHLLYTTAWAILGTPFVVQFASHTTTSSFQEQHYFFLRISAIVLVVVALFSHYRLMKCNRQISSRRQPSAA